MLVPALKVQQFKQEMYLLNLAARDVDRLVRLEVRGESGVEGKAPRRARKTALVNWDQLETRIDATDSAYQRPILKKKIEELTEYVLTCREDGQMPPLPGAVLLTTDEPVTFEAQGGNPFVGLLRLEDEEGALRVLDGQHRLLAVSALLSSPAVDETTAAAIRDLQIPAVLFAGLPSAAIVEMFVTINSKHTKLNPSLLLSLNGQKLYTDEGEARVHDIVKHLHEDPDSALHGEIKMLGVGTGRVAQAGLAQELRRVLSTLRERHGETPWISDFEAYAPKLYAFYFKEVATAFGDAWGKPGYSTHSLAALRALIQASLPVIEAVFEQGGDPRQVIRTLLEPWPKRIGSARFETAGAWRTSAAGGGKETTRRLARELIDALGVAPVEPF